MFVVANAASNLPESIIARYGVRLSPQRIVVDGIHHDTRRATYGEVDHWLATAKQPPFIQDTTAAEYVREVQQVGGEVLVLTGPRRLFGAFDAATSAERVIPMTVIDLEAYDTPAALLTLIVLEGLRRSAFSAKTMRLIVSAQVTYAYQADVSRFRWKSPPLQGAKPLVRMLDGEPHVVGGVEHGSDPVDALAEAMIRELGSARPVYLAIAHAMNPRAAEAVEARLRSHLDVRRVISAPATATFYMLNGEKSFAVAAVPADSVPWTVDGQL